MVRTVRPERPVSVTVTAAVGGKKEWNGPLGARFDYIDESDRFGKKTWEQSEAESQAIALRLALNKSSLRETDLDAVVAGDLLNQCASSSYGLMNFRIPFLGIFGACSTPAEGMLISTLMLDGGHYRRIGVVSSSHFCSAERQFRAPVEYGGQRPPTAQWTVTGAGAFILENAPGRVQIDRLQIGRIVDAGIDDPGNMGAAMAPAAFEAFRDFFEFSGKKPADYDLILTGDLGAEGSAILKELALRAGIDLKRHNDCGLMIYDRATQDVQAGGSGCGCSAAVMASYILPQMFEGNVGSVLYAATGALMSADAVKQGLCIPGIAHIVSLKTDMKNNRGERAQ